LGRGFGIDVGVERCWGGRASPEVGTAFATGVGLETGAVSRTGIVRETSCVFVEVAYADPGVERRVGTTFRMTA
jgi:hypothetical protein